MRGGKCSVRLGEPKARREAEFFIKSERSLMKKVKTFSKISKSDILVAGGKGVSLGEMTMAGILVLELTNEQIFELFELVQKIGS